MFGLETSVVRMRKRKSLIVGRIEGGYVVCYAPTEAVDMKGVKADMLLRILKLDKTYFNAVLQRVKLSEKAYRLIVMLEKADTSHMRKSHIQKLKSLEDIERELAMLSVFGVVA
jgi:hypothetical protein